VDNLRYARTCDALPADQVRALSFIKSEALKGRSAIGWIPWAGIERSHQLGRVSVLHRNDDLVGFLVWGPSQTSTKVFQIWIREDARMLIHGKEMIRQLAEWSLKRGIFRISLWCADDLPANMFWSALGFTAAGVRKGGRHSGRMHTRYVGSVSDLVWLPLAEDSARLAQREERTHLSFPHAAEEAAQRAPLLQRAFCDPA